MPSVHAVFSAGLLATVLAGSVPASEDYLSDTRAYNLAHGRVVFTEHCLRCHEQGRKGAPMLDESADWAERLAQPLDDLISHAIEGHGDMPARGDADLTDQQVASAVAYVVNRTRQILAEELDELPATAVGGEVRPQPASVDDAVVQMFLLLMGKARWK
jgi:cytochrome c5